VEQVKMVLLEMMSLLFLLLLLTVFGQTNSPRNVE
jgi:hypothetical protein